MIHNVNGDFMSWYENMKEIRQVNKLTQTELAEILGSSRPAISRYERGESPSLNYFIEFCIYFKADPKEILREELKNVQL